MKKGLFKGYKLQITNNIHIEFNELQLILWVIYLPIPEFYF